MLFSSGMAALCAVLEPALGAGDVLVRVRDGYPGVRDVATDRLAPRGVEVRFVPTDTEAIVAACPGATLVWVETPANPALGVCDIAAVAAPPTPPARGSRSTTRSPRRSASARSTSAPTPRCTAPPSRSPATPT